MIPSEVTTLPPTTPMEGTDCNSGVYLRWDLYKQLGCPELKTVEDMLDVLKQMQDLCPESDSGKKTYAFSLFKDWDDNAMKQGAWLPSLYGYRFMGDAVYSADDSLPPQSLVDDNSVYIRNLRLFLRQTRWGLWIRNPLRRIMIPCTINIRTVRCFFLPGPGWDRLHIM